MSRRKLVSSDYLISYQTRELTRYNVTNIDKGSQIDQRSDDMIYYSGLKYRFQLVNPRNEPILFHVAVLAPREYAGAGGSQDARTDFFRDVNGTRGLSFSDQLVSMELHTRGINPDRYHIFDHKRYYFGPEAGGVGENGGYEAGVQKNWKYISKYVPIKRQIRYEDASAQSCVNKIFLFVWSDLHIDAGGQTPRASLVGQYETIGYFRNSREN